jgi:hypothetical protein
MLRNVPRWSRKRTGRSLGRGVGLHCMICCASLAINKSINQSITSRLSLQVFSDVVRRIMMLLAFALPLEDKMMNGDHE